MDWNIVEGTINGWNYLDVAVTGLVALGLGGLLYKTRRLKQAYANGLYNNGMIDEEPTFWNSGRIARDNRSKYAQLACRVLEVKWEADTPDNIQTETKRYHV